MNFRPRRKEEPEINLIPFIDVLLVILIFLMLSTTYSKFTELQITQEYTGQQRHMVFLVPMWKTALDTDLRAQNRSTPVKEIVAGKSRAVSVEYADGG